MQTDADLDTNPFTLPDDAFLDENTVGLFPELDFSRYGQPDVS
jgi:hypothetical protein